MHERLQHVYWVLVGGFVAFEAVSWMVFPTATGSAAAWLLIVVLLIGLGWRWPQIPALVSLAELVVGGKGYLLSLTVQGNDVPIRIGIFFSVALTAGLWWFRQRRPWPLPYWRPVLALVAWIAIATGLGLVRGYDVQTVLTDANGYGFLLAIPLWWVLWRTRPDWREWAMVVVLAGVTWLAVKTWLLVYLFSHQPFFINDIYRWVRQTGVGEITLIQAPEYRVFLQSHVYSLLAFIVTFTAAVYARAPRWWMWPMIAGAFATSASLSRSFWVGLAVAGATTAVWFIRTEGWRRLRRWLMILPLAATVWLATAWAFQWPYIFPSPGGRAPNVIASRLTAPASAQAGDARLNQISPLWQKIKTSLIIGHGFGSSVTYYSTDPRVRGLRTTSAFELGYLDQLLKFGLVGLGLFGWLIWSVLKAMTRSRTRWLLGGSLVALLAVHLTTPYLNHPLGLGWLALCGIYAYPDER